MRIIHTVQGIQAWRNAYPYPSPRQRVGFVPTMGALHKGHESLIRQARRSCDIVVVSLFVNPLQFGPTEDFQQYPRNIQADRALCKNEKVDVLFIPTKKDIFPPGFQTSVTLHQLSRRWEGEYRPSHFQGVTTIVTKLLNLVNPTHAFFGQKDFQQTLLIKQLVKDLHLQTKIVMCSTIREPDGLAWSSRNQYLTGAQRAQAMTLYRALKAGQSAIKQGITKVDQIQRAMFTSIPKGAEFSVDYISVCDPTTLEPVQTIKNKTVLLGAGRIGHIRLIDNLLVTSPRKRGKR